jgi:hypothetical protein
MMFSWNAPVWAPSGRCRRGFSKKKRARELLWWASVKMTMNAINYPGLGEVINCLKGYPIPELLNKRVILENIELKPFIGFVKRFKDLGLKIPDGYRIIEELTARRLIVPLTIDSQRLYELTPKGTDTLGRKASHKGRGGLEHRYFIEKIREYYFNQQGFAFLEKDDIDLVIYKGDKTVAIQMETGKSDIQANLLKLSR